MGYDTALQQNDVGITFIITVVKQDGVTAQDISDATGILIYITKPDQTVVTGTATFITTGTDGQMYYNSQLGDLDQVGIYKIQGEYVVGANAFYTQKTQFLVGPNF